MLAASSLELAREDPALLFALPRAMDEKVERAELNKKEKKRKGFRI